MTVRARGMVQIDIAERDLYSGHSFNFYDVISCSFALLINYVVPNY